MINSNYNQKLKNIFIQEFNSIDDFNEFKKENPQFIIHDIQFIISNINTIGEYKILLVYNEIKNNSL